MFSFDLVGIFSIIGSSLLVIVFLYLALKKDPISENETDDKAGAKKKR